MDEITLTEAGWGLKSPKFTFSDISGSSKFIAYTNIEIGHGLNFHHILIFFKCS